ncbi:hypothetical protein EDD52_12258 [Primorskyibacter sedentarius]|uniref:Uncharacterized protein n=1 Tax=Primorskyibacter sedentarius TaxID=745311 RepID=A0A4R3J3Z0_9RHOB|nr:hypothetical protein [Primorskyibacter sedentarius]TCS59099.1 hypothetical protein EDD52_12258 [Primorskyibacter sedentarius]
MKAHSHADIALKEKLHFACFSLPKAQNCKMGPNFNNKIYISLAGSFRVWIEDQTEIAIGSVMSKRLLAILLTSPGMRKSRAALQFLLWDEEKCDPGQNLRQLLLQTRRRLGEYADYLVADKTTVWLVRTENGTNSTPNGQAEFFDDAGFGTEDFEDWLQVERANYYALSETQSLAEPMAPFLMKPRPVVALRNTGLHSISHRAGVISDWVSNHLRDVFFWNSFVQFHDLRAGNLCVDTDMELQVSVSEIGEHVEIFIGGFVDGTCRLSHSANFPAGAELGEKRDEVLEFAQRVGAIIESTVSRLVATRQSDSEDGSLYGAVVKLFTMRPDDVGQATAYLKTAAETRPTAAVLGWRAFGRMLENGERLVDDRDRRQATGDAETLVIQALDMDPYDLSALNIAAHFHAFVKRDYRQARELSDLALEIAPSSHFTADVRAMIELYDGNLVAANRFGELAIRMGRYSPMREYLAGTEVMLASLMGNFDRANEVASAVLRSRPNFLPVIRHIVPSLLETGAFDEAQSLMNRMRKLDPDFATVAMFGDDYPLPSEISREHIVKILKKHGEI